MADADLGLSFLLMWLLLLCGGLAQEDPRYWLKVQDLEVQVGLCAHVRCTFYHHKLQLNSDFNVYWFKSGSYPGYDPPVATNDERVQVSTDTQGRFRLLSTPPSQNCSLSISNARWSDTGTYYFRVVHGRDGYSYSGKHQLLRIQVKALTQKPTIHIPESLVLGRVGRLICSLPGACHETGLSFSWTGEMINPNTKASSELSFIPGLQDQGKNLSCRATVLSTGKSMERTIRFNMSYAPHLMAVDIFYGNLTATLETMGNRPLSFGVLEGQSVRLVCSAPSSPPAMLSWSQDGKALDPSWPGSSEILELSPVRVTDAGMFVCHAYNSLGSMSVSVQLSVQELPTCCNCKSRGSWPLVLTLIRGALMGTGFLLTYGLTWIYYSRCGGTRTRTQ